MRCPETADPVGGPILGGMSGSTRTDPATVIGSGSGAEHADPWQAVERTCRAAAVVIQDLSSPGEIESACRLFDDVWGLAPGAPSEMQPPLVRALQHTGNYVVGAFTAGEMIGASVGFFADPAARTLHSHITGVRNGTAGRGVGAALKWHQRAWCLDRGLDAVTWTYDPLIARNSYFNIVRLAARPVEYLVDFYGLMTDQRNAGQPTDRVLARWDLRDRAVQATAGGRPVAVDRAALDAEGARVGLLVGPAGEPERADLPADAAVVLLAVPTDIEAVRTGHPELALTWRLALREVLTPFLTDHAWRVTGFLRDGWYVLRRTTIGMEYG